MAVFGEADMAFNDWLNSAIASKAEPPTYSIYRRAGQNWLGIVLDARAALSTMLSLYDFMDVESHDGRFRQLLDDLSAQIWISSVEDVAGDLKLKI